MSSLLAQIRTAQVRAGEDAVMAHLQSIGLAVPAPQADRDVLQFMTAHAGSFVCTLAAAWLLADAQNSAKLMQAFGDVYERYAAQFLAAQGAAS